MTIECRPKLLLSLLPKCGKLLRSILTHNIHKQFKYDERLHYEKRKKKKKKVNEENKTLIF